MIDKKEQNTMKLTIWPVKNGLFTQNYEIDGAGECFFFQ